MFRSFLINTRYDAYRRNEHGIKKFAEMCVGQLVRKVAKKSAFFRQMNENMLVEKANLRLRSAELHNNTTLEPGEFFIVRRRLLGNAFVIAGVVVAAIFLTYVAVSGFITQSELLSGWFAWVLAGVLAVVLVGGGTVITERLLEALYPRRTPKTPELREANRTVAPLWAILLVGIELALLGIAETRASEFSAAEGSVLLYFGFITIIMLFPLMAGAIRWDAMQYIDLYKSTQVLRAIESRLAQIDSILRQNEEYESNFYRIQSLTYWDLLNDFRASKDNYNLRKGISENLTGHFAQTYDLFQAEANKRYSADIRDVTTKSLRKLELVGALPGQKLQTAAARTPSAVATPTLSASDGDGGYLNPQPIR